MNSKFWKRVDNAIVVLNKMESLLSLCLMLNSAFRFKLKSNMVDKISFGLILFIGLTTVLLVSLIILRRIKDENFVRTFYISDGKEIKRNFREKYRIAFITSRLPESKYIELEKEEIIFNILKFRQEYTFKYIKKILDSIYNEFDRNNQ